ncbi:uncharacterized protein [Clytia hemisphaerica]|uniref:Uncharacterized protein n=1 Tax=Clytia hemisphaerica TaxID=252671 RepID=A0A7M5V3W6_9CNID
MVSFQRIFWLITIFAFDIGANVLYRDQYGNLVRYQGRNDQLDVYQKTKQFDNRKPQNVSPLKKDASDRKERFALSKCPPGFWCDTFVKKDSISQLEENVKDVRNQQGLPGSPGDSPRKSFVPLATKLDSFKRKAQEDTVRNMGRNYAGPHGEDNLLNANVLGDSLKQAARRNQEDEKAMDQQRLYNHYRQMLDQKFLSSLRDTQSHDNTRSQRPYDDDARFESSICCGLRLACCNG